MPHLEASHGRLGVEDRPGAEGDELIKRETQEP